MDSKRRLKEKAFVKMLNSAHFRAVLERLQNISNRAAKAVMWAGIIKPLVRICPQQKKIVFDGPDSSDLLFYVDNLGKNENLFLCRHNKHLSLKKVYYTLGKVCEFITYARSENPAVPELTPLNILQDVPSAVSLDKVSHFEVCLNTKNPEKDYDDILKCHRVKVILYAPFHFHDNLFIPDEKKTDLKEDEKKKQKEKMKLKPQPRRR